jgi:hypothetical protein
MVNAHHRQILMDNSLLVVHHSPDAALGLPDYLEAQKPNRTLNTESNPLAKW